jgi:hypothetical protein
MSLTLQPVRVCNGSDEEGMLVFDGQQRLVAVLTHLGDQYGDVSGHWYWEAKFGLLDAALVQIPQVHDCAISSFQCAAAVLHRSAET